MYKNSISCVIPAYNEQDNIKKVVKNAYEFLSVNFSDFEIITVDDGSTDNTQRICQELLPIFGNRLVILRHAVNRGYGAALRTGLFSGKKDLIFYTDSDNQFDIRELGSFMNYINDYDLVIGYRKNRKGSILRKFCAFVYNRLIFVLFGLNVKDIDCSFKLFKKDTLHSLTIVTDEFLVDTELLVRAKLYNFKIKEIGVTHFPRLVGQSTVKIKHVFSTIRDLCFLSQKLKSEKRK